MTSRGDHTVKSVCGLLGRAYVVKHHPDKESLRQSWMNTDDAIAARAGWSLTTERVVKNAEGLDFAALLRRIESEIGVYRDYPVSKGCTSPFAPIWIKEMVSRQA